MHKRFDSQNMTINFLTLRNECINVFLYGFIKCFVLCLHILHYLNLISSHNLNCSGDN